MKTKPSPNREQYPIPLSKRINKILKKYGKETTFKFIEGNHQADILAEKLLKLEDIFTPLYNKYQNKYVLKSNRKKKKKNELHL